MYIPKRYGQSKVEQCPFCERMGTVKNSQGIPTCSHHKNRTLDDLKCICGRFLLIQEGKFGVFFICTNCGNMNLRKALEINPQQKDDTTPRPSMSQARSPYASTSDHRPRQDLQDLPRGPKEVTIRSDDPDYFSD